MKNARQNDRTTSEDFIRQCQKYESLKTIVDACPHSQKKMCRYEYQYSRGHMCIQDYNVYEGRPTNKLQNGIILLILNFQNMKNPKYRFCMQFNSE